MHLLGVQASHIIRLLRNTELRELFFSLSVKSFALSLTGLFIPLYLLNDLRYSFRETVLFYLVFSLAAALVVPLAARSASKAGLKHAIAMSIPFYILFYMMLYALDTNPQLLLFSAIILACAESTFWLSYHIDFTTFADKRSMKQEVGMMFSMLIAVSLIGPLAGGILITMLGFSAVFLLTAVLLCLSIIPLFKTKDVHQRRPFSLKNIFAKDHRTETPHFLALGARVMGATFWIVYLFTFLNLYTSLGLIITIANILSAMTAYYCGRLAINLKKRASFDLVVTLYGITWIVRIFFQSLRSVASLTFASYLLYPFIDVPLFSTIYKKAVRNHPVEYHAYREIISDLGMAGILLIFFISNSILLGVALTGIASFMHFFPVKE